jgi:hypothetical protein
MTVNRIEDDMTGMGGFVGDSCTGPNSDPCINVGSDQSGSWLWQGSFTLAPGDTATMQIFGQFVRFPPIGPGTPTPAPTQHCNTNAVVTYNGSSTVSLAGQVCFTLN